jgi:hypothetical protein
MRVNFYSVNHADDSLSVEAENITLESCFPDDPQDMANVAVEIRAKGFTFYGGGAAPLFNFVKVGD